MNDVVQKRHQANTPVGIVGTWKESHVFLLSVTWTVVYTGTRETH